MCFPARLSFSNFNEVEALSEPPFFVFDEIGQLSLRSVCIFCEKTKLVRYCWEQIGSYADVCEDEDG
ncbi:hypothetical protein AAHA92_17221 [Salvia divinorum]|uniref:Uncharacterized protein n=1 Tax=Salvia divinorum TaxID=28513 RepID=A0ABD1GYL8_SALDI